MIDINKIFSPKQALRKSNQKVFTGRENYLLKAIDEIAVPGASVIVYGERGVGKTSLAWQLLEILSGNITLFKSLNIKPYTELKKYHCLWVSCSRDLVSVEGLLLELLAKTDYSSSSPNNEFENRNFYTLSPELFEDKEVKEKISYTLKINLGIFQAATTVKEGEQAKSISDERKSIYSLFKEVLHKFEISTDKELLIFIDEFDRLPNKAGIGELIKLTSSARFIIVGVADSYAEIIADHDSTSRKLMGSQIRVNGFTKDEVIAFFKRAESIYPEKYKFDSEFVNLAIQYCDGFPYLLHFVGYISLRNRLFNNAEDPFIELKKEDFIAAFKQMIDEDGDSVRYKTIVSSINQSKSREHLIGILSSQPLNWIERSEIVKLLPPSLTNQLSNNLTQFVDKGILTKKDAKYKFIDPIVKAMIKFKFENNSTFISSLL